MKSDSVAVVEAARAGDAAAQDELVADCLPLVYNIVGRALDGHADVDDVVQETMLRVINGLDELRDPARFRSWLVAITTNQIRSHWRGRPEAPVSGLQEVAEVPDPRADFVDLTIVRLGLEGQRKEVAEATRWLDEGEQTVLSLWWLEAAGELTRPEVAAALELTPAHTAVRVQRTKEQLETARGVVRALGAAPRCRELAELVAPWDGVPSALWRKRIARHARACGACGGAWSALVPAERLLVGLGLVPVAGTLLGWWGGGAVLDTQAASATTATPGSAPAASHAAPSHAAPSHAASSHGASSHAARHCGGGGRASHGHRAARPRAVKRAAAGAAALAVVAGGVLGGLHFFADSSDGTDRPVSAGEEIPAKVKALDASTAALPPSAAPSSSPSPSASASTSPKASASASASAPAPSGSGDAPEPKPDPTVARPAPKAPKAPTGSGGGSLGAQVTALVNAERAKAGCSPVTENATLDRAAQGHSDDMAARSFFDHTNPDGAGPGERITAAGYRWSTYGENIAYGQQDPASVMDSWMHSDGHRRNILNCSFKEIGVGVNHAPGGPRWTQVFGAR
ncbi:sigma-70 family RNA polymerase sigma factor [Streptomyces sp. NPDC002537]